MPWWKLISCKSQCAFNSKRDCPEEMFDIPWDLQRDFTLKEKDLKQLSKIFKKRRKS